MLLYYTPPSASSIQLYAPLSALMQIYMELRVPAPTRTIPYQNSYASDGGYVATRLAYDVARTPSLAVEMMMSPAGETGTVVLPLSTPISFIRISHSYLPAPSSDES